ncbi:multicopper oxidase family protein [Agromyces salentinus]|uniref:Multicopper oxidase CueO n=1 Tax=Agromyces salentinus TaxID=269421 RepID=A0ABN2N0W1_9MICO|nr:multicopper oxidase domain-containing protein [Agromyces salentinus]
MVLTRRGFLAGLTAGGVGVAMAACFPDDRRGPPTGGAGGAGGSAGAAAGNVLAIPPLLEPVVRGDGTLVFELTAQEGASEILPGVRTPSWGYNGALLGPTVRATRGDTVAFDIRNSLRDPTTVHWHGMILPAAMDGGPHQVIEAGGSWSPEWRIDQPAATLWYHPHPHGDTAMQVYAGLAGLFIVDDDDSATAGLPSAYGIDDIPLILQDKTFADDGTLDPDRIPNFGIMGNTMLANGTASAVFHATTGAVRFRILNGSNARRYNLEFSDGRPFQVVGGDAGLLPAPVETSRVAISPAERVELVVALEGGDDVRLVTRGGGLDIDDGDFDLLRITAEALTPSSPVPARLPGPKPIHAPSTARERTFRLNGHDAINGEEMDLSRIDTVVAAGAVEIWTIENPVYAHNFHIHGAAFTVLEVAGRAPEDAMSGHKDTVFVPPRSSARIAVRFADHPDPSMPYMYHCHILRHEDEGMMGQFVTVAPGTEKRTPLRLALEGGGHEH